MNFNNRQDEHDFLSLLRREVPNDFNFGAISRFLGDERFRADFGNLCRFSGDARKLVNRKSLNSVLFILFGESN